MISNNHHLYSWPGHPYLIFSQLLYQRILIIDTEPRMIYSTTSAIDLLQTFPISNIDRHSFGGLLSSAAQEL